MKVRSKKILSLMLAAGMVSTSFAPVFDSHAEEPKQGLVSEIQKQRYVSGNEENPDDEKSTMERDTTEFMKISHPGHPANRRKFDPTVEDDPSTPDVDEHKEARKNHAQEVHPDGLIDYLGNGKVDIPGKVDSEYGDRGQSYSWTGIAYGDWMYVSTQFNSAGSTGDIMGRPANPEQADKRFGGDYFTGEKDGGNPGSTLSKINVKTGEVVVLMSASKNGLDSQFRASIEYKGKLYFCGSVNHTPSIYEVDPTNDALKCVYRDPSMVNYPGDPAKGYPAGVRGAWMVAKGERNICPAIRGITTFDTGEKEYLVISCVGIDENPYIAVSDDPSSGKFDIIAHAWNKVPVTDDKGNTLEQGEKGDLFGYPACHLRDSIFGGSIWEMVQYDGKLYVAMCTGTPETAEKHKGQIEDKEGNKVDHEFIDTMQSFALVCGEYDPSKDIGSKDAWTWTPIVGDKEADGAKYTFGIDPERTRSGACNLIVHDGHLYVGEYNDTQIAFMNMNNKDFKFLKHNLEQSISYYRMGKDQTFEKVMGSPTKMFPHTVSGKYEESGFGHKESQYIWQSHEFNDKLYFGTFDETMILKPLVKEAEKNMAEHEKDVQPQLEAVSNLVDEQMGEESAKAAKASEDPEKEELRKLNEVKEDFDGLKANGQVYKENEGDTEDGTVLLPEGTVDREPLVKIDSTEDLYLALLEADELMKTPAKGGLTEELTQTSDFLNLREEIVAYSEDEANDVPEYLESSVEAVKGDEADVDSYKDVKYIVENLEGSVAGFDMYVSENGTDFKQITRSGLGDPYNQGLRAFAVNEDQANPWMCVGSANGFYGTSIWRMNHSELQDKIVDPMQTRIKVKFENLVGETVNIDKDKSDEIFVNEGETTLTPKEVAILTPVDHKIVEPEKPVEIKDGVATIKVTPNAELSLSYKDGDQIVKTVKVPHTKGKKIVAKQYIDKNMPEGYVLADPSKKVEVHPAVSEDQNDFADVQVAKEYTVTVTNGTAKPEKAIAGTKMTVTADKAPKGKVFDKWVDKTEAPEETEAKEVKAVEFADASKEETTFTMPNHNVTVEATYATATVAEHKVTVKGGTADVKEAKKGETVTITAEVDKDHKFVNWTGDGIEFADASKEKTTFVMPDKDVIVEAKTTKKDSEPLDKKDGWVEEGSYWYYYEDGKMVKGEERKINGKTYFFTKSGAMKTGWQWINGECYFFTNSGAMKNDGWQWIEGEWYYFEENGHMLAGEKKKIEGKTYFFTSSGAMKTGWQWIDGSYYFFTNSGAMKNDGWQWIDGVWYYFEKNGHMLAGEKKEIKGETYFFTGSGAMKTGWQWIKGTWYFFTNSGTMKKDGWQWIDGYWYYFDKKGKMVTGKHTIDGKEYKFNSSGHML